MIGSTLMAPRASKSRQAGYSPDEAHDPSTAISRVTTDCSVKSIVGDRLPTKVTVPPLRTLATAVLIGDVAPTHSIPRSAPTPRANAYISFGTSQFFGFNPSTPPRDL